MLGIFGTIARPPHRLNTKCKADVQALRLQRWSMWDVNESGCNKVGTVSDFTNPCSEPLEEPAAIGRCGGREQDGSDGQIAQVAGEPPMG